MWAPCVRPVTCSVESRQVKPSHPCPRPLRLGSGGLLSLCRSHRPPEVITWDVASRNGAVVQEVTRCLLWAGGCQGSRASLELLR